MSTWPRYPTIYEINTWVWLAELSAKAGRSVDLGSVPSAEWDTIVAYGFDAVWLMGAWERSPAGISIANQNQSLLSDFRRAPPDFRPEDNVGSPYCIRGYVIDQHLGGRAGLAQARRELARRNVRLLLDFVPNHVAPDHPWAQRAPRVLLSRNHSRPPERSGFLHSDQSGHLRVRKGSILSRMAGCPAAQRLRVRVAKSGRRDALGYSLSMRRRALRYGDAALEFRFRTHLG